MILKKKPAFSIITRKLGAFLRRFTKTNNQNLFPMKNLLKLYVLPVLAGMALLMTTVSCDDDTSSPQYGPAQKAISDFVENLTYDDAYIDFGDFEFGCVYEFLEEGRITQFCVNVPDNGDYRVTLWDMTDTSVITFATVAVADSGEVSCLDITDIPVLAGAKIALTVLSQDYFWWDDGALIHGDIYPETVGSIKILEYRWEGIGMVDPLNPVFPGNINNTYYAGVAEFVFEALIE